MIGSVNADESLLLGAFAERDFALETGPRDPRHDAAYAATGPDGKPLTFADAKEVRLVARRSRHPDGDLRDRSAHGRAAHMHRATDWLNHVQFSPTDPKLVMFCHEGPWHGPIASGRCAAAANPARSRRTMNMEIAGHEFFDVDGKYDLVRPADTARRSVLARRPDPDGRNRQWYHVDRDHWSVHYNKAPNGKFFAGDGGDAEMVAHAKDGKWLYLFTPAPMTDIAGITVANADELVRPGHLRAERLVDMKRARLSHGAERDLHSGQQVGDLPLEHAWGGACLHGRGRAGSLSCAPVGRATDRMP